MERELTEVEERAKRAMLFAADHAFMPGMYDLHEMASEVLRLHRIMRTWSIEEDRRRECLTMSLSMSIASIDMAVDQESYVRHHAMKMADAVLKRARLEADARRLLPLIEKHAGARRVGGASETPKK